MKKEFQELLDRVADGSGSGETGIKIDESSNVEKKSWKNIRYKHFNPTAVTPNRYKKPTDKELTEVTLYI